MYGGWRLTAEWGDLDKVCVPLYYPTCWLEFDIFFLGRDIIVQKFFSVAIHVQIL